MQEESASEKGLQQGTFQFVKTPEILNSVTKMVFPEQQHYLQYTQMTNSSPFPALESKYFFLH